MAKTFQLDIVSPEGVLWSGEATFVVARTTDGEIGILADHEPLMGALTTGVVSVEGPDGRTTLAVHGGFVQVVDNKVTLLTDRAEIVEGGAEAARVAAAELAEAEPSEAEAAEAAGAEPAEA